MSRRQLEPVSVLWEKMEAQKSPLMTHDFYEFIFFKSGRGTHMNHGISNEFSNGDFFVVKPNEAHSFTIQEPTEVFIVRYTEPARMILKELIAGSNGRAVALAKAKSPLNPKISFGSTDEKIVLSIFRSLLQLYKEPGKNESLLYYQILCLITVIERNLKYVKGNEAPPVEKKAISRILSHIHKYLHDPEMLKLSYIASKFNMRVNYLSIHFKKETKQPIKQYIIQCRLEAAAEKVAKAELSFSEIAHQLGFVDESHFYKSFKKFYGMSPSDYRKKN